jgi:hypothetical protein
MIFANKQKIKLSASREKPRSPRYLCVAHVLINGFDGEAVLRNISNGGFCMESRTYAAITAGEQYIMQIKPEAAANINPFDLEVEVRWVRSTEISFTSGFLLVKAPAARSFKQYIEWTCSKTEASKQSSL